MSEQPQGDAVYLPGDTEQERQRLIEQAAIFRRFTEQFPVEAGIGPACGSWTSAVASVM
jgi:hypothetical protein